MNLLMISNLYPPEAVGGYEILCAQVADELGTRGHTVTVLTSLGGVAVGGADCPTPALAREEDAEVSIVRGLELTTPFGEPASWSRRRRWSVGRRNERVTREVVREVHPDVVFVWSQLRLSLGAARACQRAGVPVCYTMNDAHVAGYAPRRFAPSPRALAGALLDRGPFRGDTVSGIGLDRVTCISGVVVEDLATAAVRMPDPKVIHQGIPLERFPLKRTPGELGSPLRLLYSGQLLDYKGPDVLLRAAGILRGPEGIPVTVTIAGDGPVRGDLECLANELSVPTDFLGQVDHADMPGIYRSHDVLAFTSKWREPFGLTHLEAMASGTPVVSTANGGQAEFLEDGGNSLVVPPGDPRSLAAALATLARDPGLAATLALEGRRTVEQRFTLSRYVDDVEQWLIDASRRRCA